MRKMTLSRFADIAEHYGMTLRWSGRHDGEWPSHRALPDDMDQLVTELVFDMDLRPSEAQAMANSGLVLMVPRGTNGFETSIPIFGVFSVHAEHWMVGTVDIRDYTGFTGETEYDGLMESLRRFVDTGSFSLIPL